MSASGVRHHGTMKKGSPSTTATSHGGRHRNRRRAETTLCLQTIRPRRRYVYLWLQPADCLLVVDGATGRLLGIPTALHKQENNRANPGEKKSLVGRKDDHHHKEVGGRFPLLGGPLWRYGTNLHENREGVQINCTHNPQALIKVQKERICWTKQMCGLNTGKKQ